MKPGKSRFGKSGPPRGPKPTSGPRSDGAPRSDFKRRDDRPGGPPRKNFGPRSDAPPRPDFKRRDDRPSGPPRKNFGPRSDGPPRPDFKRRDDRPTDQRDDRPRKTFGPRSDGPPRPDFKRRDDRPTDRRDERPRKTFGPRSDAPSRPDFKRRDDRPNERHDDRPSGPPRKNFGPRSDAPSRPTDRRDERPRKNFGPRSDAPPRSDFKRPDFKRRDDRPTAKSPAEEPRTVRPEKTLDRVLSKAGLASRTTARSWIHERRVEVNGETVENPDQWIDPKAADITIDGRPLSAEKPIYLLLYKPKGFVTTAKDPDGRPTVYNLISDIKIWVAPVGRLDLDTTGLLILTNDTQFAERLTNPDHEVPKTYQVKARGLLTEEQFNQLRNGVELDDGPTKPAVVTPLRHSEKYSFLEITLKEGRNRQVRKMLEAIGSKVMKLTRVAIGPIRIGDLQIGKYRELTPDELTLLTKKETD